MYGIWDSGFVDGEVKGDYFGHRTVVELAHFVEQMEIAHKGSNNLML
jgi:hypothetical protein